MVGLSGRATRYIQADVFTASYRLSGKLGVGTTGIMGMFGESDISVVDLQDIYVSRIIEPGAILAHFGQAVLPKTAVQLIIALNRADLGPEKIVRGGLGGIVPYDAFIGTPDFEVRGTVEQAGKFDPKVLLAGATGLQPVFEANVTSTRKSDVKYAGVAVLVNRKSIDFMAR